MRTILMRSAIIKRLKGSVSGKKVVIYSLLGFTVFTAVMGYGAFAFAQWLTPILRERAKQSQPKAATVPSPSNSSSPN